MRKVIAAINMTLDGYCDHTAIDPDQEIHDHYTELLQGGEVILYGRATYELMEFWKPFVKKPSGERSMDDFAQAIDRIRKMVFSRTLKSVDWHSARLADRSLEEAVRDLKAQNGGDIFVGSRSLIIQLMKLDLLDELQLCIHPVIAGSGMQLFESMSTRKMLKLERTKTFRGGAVIMYYSPIKAM